MQRFAGRNVIVTGSTRGLGLVTAERFAAEGATVALTGRRAVDVEAAVQRILAGGGKALGLAADLADERQGAKFVEWAVEALGGVDVLVNNAGTSIPSAFLDVKPEDIDYQFKLLFKTPYLITQTAVRWMAERRRPGSVIFISSVGATAVHPDRNVYDSLKRGLECLTMCLGAELGPLGIRVNAVSPGGIPVRPGDSPAGWGGWDRFTPIRRFGTADDIAAAVLFLASDDAGYVCGQTLLVDGGLAGRMPLPPDFDLMAGVAPQNVEDRDR